MHKKNPFYKRPIPIILAALVVIGASWVIFALNREKVPVYNTIVAEHTDLVQEVSVTGNVKPLKSVSLSFEISGKVDAIFVDVGDRVIAGEKLISLTSFDLQAQLRQAQAGVAAAIAQLRQYEAVLDTQKAKLDEIKKGTRPEEIRISLTALNNAKTSLADSMSNLETVLAKAEADIANTYDSARTTLPIAVDTGKTALLTFSDIQSTYFIGNNQEKYRVEDAKGLAVAELLGASGAGGWNREFISILSGGVYGQVQNLSLGAGNEEIEEALMASINALQQVKLALNAIPIKDNMTSGDILRLDTEKININAQINTLSGHEQAISLQKATNQNLITTAENQVNTAENSLSTARDELRLKQAGATDEQIRAQEAQVRQAEANRASQRAQVSSQYANVQNYQAKLEKAVLYTPISGLVTKMEAKVGEIIFPSSQFSASQFTLVSIISDMDYEIETFVAEVDIAKVKVGDESSVTLDAYGSDIDFLAVVKGIDPAETIIEGIPTYKVTLIFAEEDTEIKSGMTANLDILTEKLENVIAIPQRAVISRGKKKIVRILKEAGETVNGKTVGGTIEEREVKTGIRGSDGRIQILEGLSVGDLVVVSIEE